MLCGCRWYFNEQIKIELATKNGSFVHIKDPISFPEFEQLDQFKFTQTERHSNKSYWKICVDKAVANIEDFKNNSNLTTIKEDGRKRGRFVFVITDFERNRNGNEKDFLQDIDRQLAENNIFFRYVQLKFDDHKQTQITTGGGKSSTINERIRNISSNVIRVAIVEQGSDFDAFVIVRPCPQLNDAEKIREYSDVQNCNFFIFWIFSIFADFLIFLRILFTYFVHFCGFFYQSFCPSPLSNPRNFFVFIPYHSVMSSTFITRIGFLEVSSQKFCLIISYSPLIFFDPRGAVIGFALCLFAILCAISSYLFHIWEQARIRKKIIASQQPGHDI
uniref:Uncharacterized protein n=1 Tax=Meloidogyne incognita TaxID=6306 RepID=A0A914KJ18_MELIC